MEHEQTEEQRDVDLIDRDMLEPEFQASFVHRWIVQWPNGFTMSFPTEQEAAMVQSRWRAYENIGCPITD